METARDGAPILTRRRVSPIIRCKTSGRTYRASYPHGWDDGAAMAAAFSGETRFYFREIKRLERPWWRGGTVWRDTGEIWEPKSGEFEVEARRR